MTPLSETPATIKANRQASRKPVEVFAGFNGVINPEGTIINSSKLVELSNIEEVRYNDDRYYAIDRHGLASSEFFWSSELLGQIDELIEERRIKWHWLSSEWMWFDEINPQLGLSSQQAGAKSMVSRTDKPYAIKRAIKHNARRKHARDIIWLDDAFGSNDRCWKKLTRLVEHTRIRLLKITTDPTTGLSRDDFQVILRFIDDSNRLPGVQFRRSVECTDGVTVFSPFI